MSQALTVAVGLLYTRAGSAVEPAPLAALLEAVAAAGAVVRRHAGRVTAEAKTDGSPVTAADREAEAILLGACATHLPDVPVVAEEQVSAQGATAPPDGRFILIDPLDGTREFLAGGDEVTVNLALLVDGVPRLGIVAAPLLGITWWTDGLGAWRGAEGHRPEPIACRRARRAALCALVSRSHRDPETDRLIAGLAPSETVAVGSSLKFCRIAEGAADLYPRLGPTMEWDIAAGHAVLAAAGGRVLALDGTPVRYGKPGWRSGGFVALGPGLDWPPPTAAEA